MSRRTRIALAAAVTALSLAVAAAPASAGTPDQQQTSSNASAFIAGPNAVVVPEIAVAQTFTAGISGQLDQVDLLLLRSLASGPLTVEIHDVSSGVPGSSVLASASVPAADVPDENSPGPAFVPVSFAVPAAVLAGSQYAIVAYAGGADIYEWYVFIGSDVYAGGGAFSSLPSTWTALGGDFAFKTYVIPDEPATIADLIDSVEALNPPSKIENSLLKKLTGAQRNLDSDDTAGACDKLASFIAEVTAQSGKKIDTEDADALITEAEAVRESLDCG